MADTQFRLRGEDAVSRAFQTMAEQGHYAGAGPRHTRQGIYMCTADGELLASSRPDEVDAVLDAMKRALNAWNDRSGTEARSLPELERVATWEDRFPVGGLVLKLTVRHLFSSEDEFSPIQRSPSGGRSASLANLSNLDHVWFSQTESLEWIPEKLEVGQRRQLRSALVERLVCLHLVDSVSGRLPVRFRKEDVDDSWIWTEVVAREEGLAHLRITGKSVAHARGRELRGSANRVETNLLGYATFNTVSNSFERFEAIAIGKGTDFRAFAPISATSRVLGFAFDLQTSGERKTPPHFIHRYEADWVTADDGRDASALEKLTAGP